MTTIYAVNVPVTSYQDVVLCAYQFWTFCAQFPVLYTSSAQFGAATVLESNTGVVNAASPSRFFSSAATFLPAHVGKYIAVRDPNNANNTAIVVITAFVSSTEVQCNAPVANFSVSASGLSFRVFDPTILPNPDDFFVFTNMVGQSPTWQCICKADNASTSPAYEMMPIGGFDVGTALPTGPTSGLVYQFSTVAQAFFVADPSQGWGTSWTEDVGGVGSLRAMVWLGSVGSTHAAAAPGFPADPSYAGIMGSTLPGVASTVSRIPSPTTVASGSFGNPDGSGIAIGEAIRRRTSSSGSDILSIPAAATNPRSAQAADYDVIVGHYTNLPQVQAVRGYLPGIRHLNNSLINRSLISGGATYVIGSGVGVVWNGKPTV